MDKFAQVTRKEECGKLFGAGSNNHPPDLIIQDELHLIAGPLGTLTGIYETAIDELCKTDEGAVKIIGSTATIRRAEEQVNSLFARSAFQFPPAAIDADNSGFAKTNFDGDGRLYIGLSTAGRSPKFALQAVAATLLQSSVDTSLNPATKNFYETLVSYYNSLKELGGALVVMQDDVPDSIDVFARRRGETARQLGLPEELTSRKPSSEIPQILEKLKIEFSYLSRKEGKNHINYSAVDTNTLKEHLLIINASPVGTFPDVNQAPNLPYEFLTNNHILYDLIYNPPETLFLKEGKKRGCTILNGYKMLEYQAEKSWDIWNQ